MKEKECPAFPEYNSYRMLDRRQFLRYLSLFPPAIALAACSQTPSPTEESTTGSVPSLVPSPTIGQEILTTPTVSSSTLLTPSPEVPFQTTTATSILSPTETPTPSALVEHNAQIEYLLETKAEGEYLSLEKPLVKHVIVIPRPLMRDAYYATLAKKTNQGNDQVIGIVENADCLYQYLSEKDLLGNNLGQELQPVNSGVWRADFRPETMEVRVYIRAAIGTVPMVTLQELLPSEDISKIACPKNSIFEEAGDLPRQAATRAARFIKEIYEGLKEGFEE